MVPSRVLFPCLCLAVPTVWHSHSACTTLHSSLAQPLSSSGALLARCACTNPPRCCALTLPAPQGGLDGEEARVLEKRFDPSRNYYEILGIPRCAAAAFCSLSEAAAGCWQDGLRRARARLRHERRQPKAWPAQRA